MRNALVGALLFVAAGLVPAAGQPANVSIDGTSSPTSAASGSSQSPAPPAGIDVGPLKNVRFSGLIQVWYQAGGGAFVDTFRLRRTRLYISGELPARARFMVMVDPSRVLAINQDYVTIDGTRVVQASTVNQASRILQDAYIGIGVLPHLDVQVGQFKLPMNLEGSMPVQEMPLVERSLMTTDRLRGGAFGDIRDIGLMARGTFANGLEYRVGVFNGLGSGQNDVDKDDRKAVAGRLAYRTPLAGLQVGVFGAADRDTATETDRRRAGVDVRYLRGPLLLQGELVGGRDGALVRQGYYATLACRVRPALELAARLDTWDPDNRADTTVSNIVERDYVGGVNYYISGTTLKWQAEYLHKTFGRSLSPSRNVFLTSLQLVW